MTAISITDLNNAKEDVDHIASIATSQELTATDRMGNVKKTLAGKDVEINQGASSILALSTAQAQYAAASALETLGYLQAYRATSYGALISDPALDPLGNPPTVGDEYFNTTNNLLKRWNGSIWQASDISTANLAAIGGSLLIGRPSGTVGSKLDETPSLKDTGGIADYVGTPLYDGADVGRVTATDNTTAFNNLINTAISSGRTSVKIPAGHWAIKTGNLAFSSFNKLKIYGDGIGVTILDFIKEDTTRVAYVDNATPPHVIASFTTGNALEFADLTVKATTKGGIVNGTSGPSNSAAVYFGGVWGFKINNVKDIRFTRVRVERFNYRGFSVYGPLTERVTMTDCEGFYNVGSGFWVQDAALFKISGGEFAYNGIFGENGTGYGATASSAVGKFLVERVYCHHNYRKGIDSHGCAQFVIKSSTFENNVLYHFANPNWNPPTGISDCTVIVKGNTFSNGKLPTDKAWLKTCYESLATNGYATNSATCSAFSIFDTSSAGTVSDKMKSILVEDNTLVCHYNGGGDAGLTTSAPGIDILSNSAKTVFRNNNFNFEYMGFPLVSQIYSQVVMNVNCPDLKLSGNTFTAPTTSAYTNSISAVADRGAFLSLITSANPMSLELHNNRFRLNDCYFITSTAAGVRAGVSFTVSGSKRLFTGNTWDYTDDPFKDFSGLNNAYFLGQESSTNAAMVNMNNTFLRNGFAYWIPEGPLNRTTSSVGWRAEGINKTINTDVFSIILDKQYSTSIRISTSDGSPDLFISIAFSSYAGITGSAGNSLLSYSSVDPAFIENGVTKLKITVKAKVAMIGDFWGRITVDGMRPSLGIERVVLL